MLGWIRRHRATVGFLILGVGVVLALARQQVQIDQACTDRHRGWDTSHNLVVKAYAPSAPSPALLKAFPELIPFYTPGYPQYDEQQRRTQATRDQVLATLGDRPVC